ncbi:type I polyketide synthase [Streptomyces sp. NPDC060232]|uniref:type I polyketide synthase n=1 Tax=Streptomyces sp. NPDC060232 TaxID=3347079 RepID=UPI003649FF52
MEHIIEGDVRDSDVAVVGMACRFPGSPDVDAFWKVLTDGRETVTVFSDDRLAAAGVSPAELADPAYVKAGQVIGGVEMFDAAHFKIPGDEAEILDPQHRHLLECSLLALEDAGLDPTRHAGEIGVFAGTGMNTYLLHHLADRYRSASTTGHYRLMLANDKDFLATRVSYKLDLRGPSISVNTACSTSLVAVHTACTSLLAGECSVALAGAVHLRLPEETGYVHQQGMIFSPDGHCRAFDADAQGTVIGSGVGVVVLKRLAEALADGDTVHAVIKGSAVNNDGSAKTGYTAPSVEGQAAVIVEAQDLADCPPETIGYVEAHGTGTPLGDPIEVAALTEAFGTGVGPGQVALGSVKTNIGHLDTAAGMAGLIKTVLMLRERTIVPSLNFRVPNPDIDFAAGPFAVATELREWTAGDTPLRAGVSSFGIGGTNAHVVLEEPPRRAAPGPRPRPAELLVLTARTPRALDQVTSSVARSLKRRPGLGLGDVAHTLAAGRRLYPHRRAVVARTTADGALALAIADPVRVRTGEAPEDAQGTALVVGRVEPTLGTGHDGAALYRELPAFRAAVDDCAHALELPASSGPESLLASEGATARFVARYALARVWEDWGLLPTAYVGLGEGKIAAGCLAGVLALGDALALTRAHEAGDPAPLPDHPLNAPEVPLCAGEDAVWLDAATATDPAFWAKPSEGPGGEEAAELLAQAVLIAVPVEPVPQDDPQDVPSRPAQEVLLDALGRAWVRGADVDWDGRFPPEYRRRVPLPGYPLERTRHWVDPVPRREAAPYVPSAEPAGDDLRQRIDAAGPAERGRLLQDYLSQQVAGVLGARERLDPDRSLFDMDVDSLILIDLTARLGTALGRQIPSSAFVEYPTIRAFAEHVAADWEQGGGDRGGSGPGPAAGRTSRRAATAAHRR